jgi:hypothetical protein
MSCHANCAASATTAGAIQPPGRRGSKSPRSVADASSLEPNPRRQQHHRTSCSVHAASSPWNYAARSSRCSRCSESCRHAARRSQSKHEHSNHTPPGKRQRREHRRRESTAAWDESERSKTSSRASTHRTSDTSGPQKGQRPATERSASRRRRTASSRNRWEPNTSAIERRPAKPGLFNHGCRCWLEANQDLATHYARSTTPFNVRRRSFVLTLINYQGFLSA